ncbi:MAG: hypothetical protein HQ494_09220 [Rhodospirillales bacterium]|nr:hypothetical protein [Rhodospirillales bacterium]
MLEFILTTVALVTAAITIIYTDGRLAKAIGVVLSLALYLGALYLIETKGENWQLEVQQRKQLSEFASSTIKKFPFRVFWHESSQSKNYAEDVALTFARNGWRGLVYLDPSADITRNVPAGIYVAISNFEQSSNADAIYLHKLLKDSGLGPHEGFSSQDVLSKGQIGIVVAKQPIWRVSDLWR